MKGEAWFNLRSRRIVLVDQGGLVWRLIAVGATEPREPKPWFEIVPGGDGSFALCVGSRKRVLRLETTDDTPEPPQWRRIELQRLAELVLGKEVNRNGVSWVGMAKRAMGFALEAANVASQIKRVLGQT